MNVNAIPSHPGNASTPLDRPRADRWRHAHTIHAIAGVVILEMYRRKDFYVLFVLTALLTLLLGSMQFFNEQSVVRYLKEITLLLIWISSLVIAITTTARQLPSEREQRTIFPLLAKPVTRTELLLGKFWGCWLVCGLTLALFYAFFILVTGAREHAWPLGSSLQAITLHWFMLGIVVALTLLGSILFTAPSATVTITFIVAAGILLLARHLNTVALQLSEPWQTLLYTLYFTIPHLEFFDVRTLIIHNWGAVPWSAWIGALLYGAVYMTLFLVAAAHRFRRRPLN